MGILLLVPQLDGSPSILTAEVAVWSLFVAKMASSPRRPLPILGCPRLLVNLRCKVDLPKVRFSLDVGSFSALLSYISPIGQYLVKDQDVP